jgi:hypothetical protein
MDEKQPSQRVMLPIQARRSRPTMALIVTAIVTYTFWIWQPFRPLIDDESWVHVTNDDVQTDTLIPLEAHIMSKCPDAKVTLVLVVSSLKHILINC